MAIACAGIVLANAGQCSAQRMVFAHYMLTNQDYQADDDPTQEKKIAAYEREIREAQAVGIDGFALNAGGWLRQTYYIRYAAQMFEAAVRLHSGFQLMFSADMCCGNGIDDVEDMMRRFAGNPRYASVYFHYHDRAVLTTFAGEKLGAEGWQQIRDDLAHRTHPSNSAESTVLAPAAAAPGAPPLKIFFVPAFFWGGELPSRQSIEQGFDAWKNVIDGAFYWGIAGVPGSGGALDQIPSAESYARVLHRSGKLFMAPVCLQFWGSNANRYYEYSGAVGMRAMWMDVIEVSHPEWVEIVTWNDFIEGTYVSPIEDPNKYPGANFLTSSGVPLNTRDYFHSHAGATALLSYFIEWYKTGKQPAITRDSIYFFYRTQRARTLASKPPVDHMYGDVKDVLYITANLTAGAKLRIESGGHTMELDLKPGSTDEQAPLFAGPAPKLTLVRNGKLIAAGTGLDAVAESPQLNDFYYSTGSFGAPR